MQLILYVYCTSAHLDYSYNTIPSLIGQAGLSDEPYHPYALNKQDSTQLPPTEAATVSACHFLSCGGRCAHSRALYLLHNFTSGIVLFCFFCLGCCHCCKPLQVGRLQSQSCQLSKLLGYCHHKSDSAHSAEWELWVLMCVLGSRTNSSVSDLTPYPANTTVACSTTQPQ